MTDNDRELLELAAKAAGHNVRGWINDRLVGWDAITGNEFAGWNPLESDGDAFRLMNSLRMRIEHHIRYPFVAVFCGEGFERVKTEEQTDSNINAATRRAIVTAAAEIGRGMKDANQNER